MKTRLNYFLFLFSFVISPALAYPNVFPSPCLNGSTGLIRIPDASVVPYKNFNFGADMGTTFISGSATSETAINYKMNLGAFHGLELGIVGGTEQNSGKMREGVFVNMKLSLASGEETYPLLLALGVENLFSYTKTDVYMVATKYFKQGPKATFGFMADFPNNKFRPMGIAGIELPTSENLFIDADMMAGETLFQVNAGIKLYITPIFSVNLYGINILDTPQAKDGRLAYAGFSWANPF
ncbi:MAG: hypothetical protein WCV91_00220 [Candidatus Margulisiibacteriota bacterium]